MFQTAANPTLITGPHQHLTNVDAYGMPDDADYVERPSCVTINVPTEFDNRRNRSPSLPPDEMYNWANPDALTIRFGYSD